MNKFKIFLIKYIIIIKLNVCTSNIIRFPFSRNYLFQSIEGKFNPENLVFNDLIINLVVGSNHQTLPMSLRFSEYSLFIIGSDNTGNYTKFEEKKSETFRKKNDTLESFFFLPFKSAYDSNDDFFINDKKINNMNFFLSIDIDPQISKTTKAGMIGLNERYKKHKKEALLKNKNFINQLKEKKIISSYSFYFQYTEYDKGEFIIGGYPHEYDKNYNKNNYVETKIEHFEEGSQWQILFDNITYGDKSFTYRNKATINLEYGMIYSTQDYKANIDKNFFIEQLKINKCWSKPVTLSKTSTNNFIYICDKDVNISNVKPLKFILKDINMTFEFDYHDLFELYDDKYYFMVLLRKNENTWNLGKPFFKKYTMVFDQDLKIIGFYNKNKIVPTNPSFIKIIFLFILIGILILLIYLIMKNKLMKKKRYKAKELDLDNDYSNLILN